MPESTHSPTHWIPELDSPAIVYLLLALGGLGTIAELTSTMFLPRLLLYFIGLAAGLIGLRRIHRRRTSPRRA